MLNTVLTEQEVALAFVWTCCVRNDEDDEEEATVVTIITVADEK